MKGSRILLAGTICCILASLCMYYSVWLFPIYAPLFLAAFVIGIISMAKGRVWSGLGTFLAASILPGILLIALTVVPNGRELKSRFEEWRGANADFSTTDQQISLGETATTPTFEFKVVTAKRRRRVGSLFRGEAATDGAVYLVVTWYYKNTSSEPVGPRERPKMTLLSPGGQTYEVDVPANGVASGESARRSLVSSSVNPGVQMRRVDVFEVPKDKIDNRGWRAVISADEQVAVALK